MHILKLIIFKTKKRGNAQRVVCPVQMRLCIPYSLTDWLCCCHLVNDL